MEAVVLENINQQTIQLTPSFKNMSSTLVYRIKNNFFYKFFRDSFFWALAILSIPFLIILSLISRGWNRKIQIGIGPYPLINNVYHKMALQKYGFTAETFVNQVYFITDKFDVRGDDISRFDLFRSLYLFLRAIFNYQCLYIYYNGGPLGGNFFLWRLEPYLYKLAGVRIVVMAYGADVQDLTRSSNLNFKHAMSFDYPEHRKIRKKIDRCISLWSAHGSYILSGCEWVDYVPGWDQLMLAHFSIDIAKFDRYLKNIPAETNPKNSTFRIFHAPNHRTIKGTNFFIQAVNELKEEGLNIELVMREKVSNQEVLEVMSTCDVVADQLIVGWYAMFAIEAMSMKKPVLCYLREDLINLYRTAGLIQKDEIPIQNCDQFNLKDKIRFLMQNRESLHEIGEKSRAFVEKFHSLESVGKSFLKINTSLGIMPN